REELLQLFLEHLHEIAIRTGEQSRRHLDDGDLAAEGGVDGAELETDVAAANHQQRLRHIRQLETRRRVHHPRAVEREGGDLRRMRAGGEYQMLELELGVTRGASDLERLRTGDRGAALNELHLPQLGDAADAGGEFIDDALLVGAQPVDVDTRLGEGHAPVAGVPRFVDDLRDVQQRLRGNAPAIE